MRNYVKGAIALSLLLGVKSLTLTPAFSQSLENAVRKIILLPFSEYAIKPETEERTIDFELEKYLNETPEDLKKPSIKNYEKFKEQVLKCSGKTLEEISKLSIKDSLLLAGKIVRDRIDYNNLIFSEEDAKLTSLQGNLRMYNSLFKKEEIRSKERIRVDNLSDDEIFINKEKVVCTGYASVFVSVFEVLKYVNPNLKNTRVRVYAPESEIRALELPHAWDLASTATSKGVFITYVEPTWLDTRKNTKTSGIEIFDAFDEEHFGEKMIYSDIYLADLYKRLGENYKEEEFNKRIEISSKLFEIMGDEQIYVYLFGENLGKLVENFAEENVYSVKENLFDREKLQKKKKDFQKIEALYRHLQEWGAPLIDEYNIGYSYKDSSGRLEWGNTNFETLFRNLKEAYRN